MKNLLFIIAIFVTTNIQAKDYELMKPVKLESPLNQNLNFEGSGPKYNVYKKQAPKIFIKVPEQIKVKETVTIKETLTANDVTRIINETKPETKEDIKPEITQEIKTNPETDKNIDEAKRLLKVAEHLANSMIEEEDKKTEIKEPVKTEIIKTEPQISIKINFKDNAETIKISDEKNVLKLIPVLKSSNEKTAKIVSYYKNNDDRNIAFTRLLNTRKILLDKSVPTSQIMILVVEDKTKPNLIEASVN